VFISGAEQFAGVNSSFFADGNFQVAAYKIGVRVRFDYGYNAGIVQGGKFVIRLRIAGRIYQGNFAFA
jgi:hypothetical protein